jgi:peptide/nickel transport system substrate-binding protein
LAVTAYDADDIERARYMLFDSRDRLRFEGDAVSQGNGRWVVALSPEQIAELGTGANTLELAVTSRHVALPAFATQAFATVPD